MISNWKDAPQLFANGKFKVLAHEKGYEDEVYRLMGIEVLRHDEPKAHLALLWNVFDVKWPLRDCTLIARKIDSLTNKEKMGLVHATGWTFNQETWDKVVQDYIKGEKFNPANLIFDDKPKSEWEEHLIDKLSSKIAGFIYLLGVGIYPLSQSHFESGEVIDVKELEEKDEK